MNHKPSSLILQEVKLANIKQRILEILIYMREIFDLKYNSESKSIRHVRS